jgi:hypothetical protein
MAIYNMWNIPDNGYDRWVNRLNPICQHGWALDLVHPQIELCAIDPWDTWSLDHTLADIILPA